MKRYRFFWLGGKSEDGVGETTQDAFTHLGYGAGAIRALDQVVEISNVQTDMDTLVWSMLNPDAIISIVNHQNEIMVGKVRAIEMEDGSGNCFNVKILTDKGEMKTMFTRFAESDHGI